MRNIYIPILHKREMRFKGSYLATVTPDGKWWGRCLRPRGFDSDVPCPSSCSPLFIRSLVHCNEGREGQGGEVRIGDWSGWSHGLLSDTPALFSHSLGQ